MQGLTLVCLWSMPATTLTFNSSFEGFFSEAVLSAESICQSSRQRLWLILGFFECTSLGYVSCNLPFNMTFLYNDQKGTFIWKQIKSFILACIQWGAKKRNCGFLMVSEIQNRNYMMKAGRVLHQPVAGSRFCGQSVLYTIEGTADTDCFFFGQNIWKTVKFMKEITKTSFLELNCFCLIDILLLVWMVIFFN